MKNNEQGRSMVEMLGVLAIIGVLSIGGIAGYSKAMNKYKVNKVTDQVTQIVAGTRALFAGHRTYAALGSSNNVTLITKAHLFPDDLITTSSGSAAVADNIFHGSVTLKVSDKKTSNDNKAFVITYTNIPQEACVDLATQDWGAGTSSGMVAISINDSSIDSTYTSSSGSAKIAVPGSSNPVPMKVSSAVSACSNAQNNTIYWKFY